MAWTSVVLGLGGLALGINSVELWSASHGAYVWPWGTVSWDAAGDLAMLTALGAAVLGCVAIVLGILGFLKTRYRRVAAVGILLGTVAFFPLAYFVGGFR